MTNHHFSLPDNWTYSQLARDIIGEPAGNLMHLCDVLKDLTITSHKIDPLGSWSMMAFLLILTMGSLYEWKRGASDQE
ncbi:hypothetical protein VNO77_43749 [Canavalia gladiata]|uniref:Uncharacterized protein n=1 Tax=Canavalia gladiata TaxID=3824 RepID=A0AAN9PQ57_CANGL